MKTESLTRRPIKARDSRWAGAVARRLTGLGVRPNGISVMSVVFAIGAGAALVAIPCAGPFWARAALYLTVAVCIPLRLLCNLFDGMVAVEGGLGGKTGELYNEVPDRISDSLILIGAGYAAGSWGVTLGWTAALLALLTAYVRALGGAVGVAQPFGGPMAKQQRMVVVVAACLLGIGEDVWRGTRWVMAAALVVVIVGCVVTVIRRLRIIAGEMEAR